MSSDCLVRPDVAPEFCRDLVQQRFRRLDAFKDLDAGEAREAFITDQLPVLCQTARRLDLSGRQFRYARFEGTIMPCARLTASDLTGAELDHANLTGVRLGDANLTGADLDHANLTGAGLFEANLTGARLGDAILTGADLRRTNLTGAELWDANLTGARLSRANLNSAGLWGANLTAAELWNANLTAAELWNANLTAAELWNANLTGAQLGAVNFAFSDLSGAVLAAASWTGAELPPGNLIILSRACFAALVPTDEIDDEGNSLARCGHDTDSLLLPAPNFDSLSQQALDRIRPAAGSAALTKPATLPQDVRAQLSSVSCYVTPLPFPLETEPVDARPIGPDGHRMEDIPPCTDPSVRKRYEIWACRPRPVSFPSRVTSSEDEQRLLELNPGLFIPTRQACPDDRWDLPDEAEWLEEILANSVDG